jgi:hypothetical protein
MVRRRRDRSSPLAWWAMVVAGACLLPACGLILGLDQGAGLVESSDGSIDVTTTHPPGERADGEVHDDAERVGEEAAPAPPTDESTAPNDAKADSASPVSDAGPGDGCTPDPGWCDSHCGNGADNCGEARQCPTCAAGNVCGPSNTCKCQSEPGWCTGRCGQTTDNCGSPIDCGSCGSSPCVAESYQQACGSRQCGQATDNCEETVNCGFLGFLSTCTNSNQVCLADGGCCTPSSAAACGNQCGTFATDNCGRSVQCPSSCGAGRVCYQSSCCTPTDPCAGACGVTRVNGCGQTVQCGCSAGNAECIATTHTCCVPQGCSANCVDSCGLAAPSCCVDAGPDGSAGATDAAADAGPPEASPVGDDATETSTGGASGATPE